MKKLLYLIGVVVIISIGFGVVMYYEPVKSIKKHKSAYQITSENLVNEYESDEALANEKYQNKIVEVSGIVDNINKVEEEITIRLNANNIMSSVLCEMEPEYDISSINKGDRIIIKGVCTGYLLDIVLVQSVIVENPNF